MHAYLRSVGFKHSSKQQVEKLVKEGIAAALADNRVKYHADRKKAFLLIPVSKFFGVSVVCDYVKRDRLKADYCMPYLVPLFDIKVDSIYVERHSFQESFGMMCDDIKEDSTIVCTLENAYDISLDPSIITELKSVSVGLSAFCAEGTILLPIRKLPPDEEMKKRQERREYIKQAKEGNQKAIEYLTLEDFDTLNSIARRVDTEDIFSIVETTFIPCGVECDTYSIVGEIMSFTCVSNEETGETVVNMLVECNDVTFNVAVNKEDLTGEPKVGRRFKGRVWLTGRVFLK